MAKKPVKQNSQVLDIPSDADMDTQDAVDAVKSALNISPIAPGTSPGFVSDEAKAALLNSLLGAGAIGGITAANQSTLAANPASALGVYGVPAYGAGVGYDVYKRLTEPKEQAFLGSQSPNVQKAGSIGQEVGKAATGETLTSQAGSNKNPVNMLAGLLGGLGRGVVQSGESLVNAIGSAGNAVAQGYRTPEENAALAEHGPVVHNADQIYDQAIAKQQQKPGQSAGDIIREGIGGTIFGQSHLLNMASKLLGLGPLNPAEQGNAGAAGLYGNANQSPTPFDARINQDILNVQATSKSAPFNDISARRYDVAKSQLAQDMALRDKYFESQQNIGVANPAQSEAFRATARNNGALVNSTNNLFKAVEGNATPQELEANLDNVVLSGDLSNVSPAVLMAATQGKLMSYLGDPGNIAVADVIKGKLKGVYSNARVAADAIERYGNQIMNVPKDKTGNYDKTSNEFKIMQSIAPYFGEENGGLPNQEEFNKAVDALDFTKSNVGQAAAKGKASGEAMGVQTLAELKGLLNAGKISAQQLSDYLLAPEPPSAPQSQASAPAEKPKASPQAKKGSPSSDDLAKYQRAKDAAKKGGAKAAEFVKQFEAKYGKH